MTPNPLDAVTAPIPGLEPMPSREDMRCWWTPDGDGVGVYHFPLPPDLPGPLDAPDRLFLGLSRGASQAGAAIVEASVIEIAGYPAVRQIIKVARSPRGLAYVGSVTLPFRDCSWVIKIQCEERGMTGVRETVLLARALRDGTVSRASDTMTGWMVDPFDPSRTGFARSLADDEQHDAAFPNHPVSRARRFLASAQACLAVDRTLRDLAAFTGPPSTPP